MRTPRWIKVVAVLVLLSYAVLWVRSVTMQRRLTAAEFRAAYSENLAKSALALATDLQHQVSGKPLTPPISKSKKGNHKP